MLALALHFSGGEMRRLLTLLATLTLAGAAHAQAVPQTSGLAGQREEVVALDGRRLNLAGQRIHLESELDGLSAQIARLKSRSGSLLGGGSLDHKLVRSRELSAQIDTLRARETKVAHALEQKAGALLAAYDANLIHARRVLEAAKGETRSAALEHLATLENERAQVRAGLARLLPDAGPHFERTLRVRAAEHQDPESLRAEADRLRDTRDRLLRRIRSLQRRADELHAQAELDAEIRSFSAETSLFDEADYSVVRLTSSSTRTRGAVETSATANSTSNDADLATDGVGGGAQNGTADPAAGFASPPAESRNSEATRAAAAGYDDSEAFFQLGRSASRAETLESAAALLGRDDRDGSAETLEARETEMKKLAERLKARAEILESRAETLDR